VSASRTQTRADSVTFWLPVAAAAAVSAFLGTVAADARWLAALGAYIVRRGSIPDFVPYAAAPSGGWHNVPALGELAFHFLEALGGDRALLIAQVLAVGFGFAILAVDARRAGASRSGALLVLFLAVPSAFTAIPLVRAQLFSLALFPLLVLLLRSESRAPSRRVWLLLPLIALWSNLHGAVLVGLAVAGTYLVFERARREPWVAAGALAGSVVALFATPALWNTGSYYAGVLGNEAARRGIGLWARPSLSSPVDVIFTVGAIVLVAAALRGRPRPWEVVVLVGLALLSLRAVRAGVWLVFFTATPAAFAFGSIRAPRARVAVPILAVLFIATVFGLVRGPHDGGARGALLDDALRQAAGTPILATDLLAEQVALAGGRIWIGNPIDAFPKRDQRVYLDWLQGRSAGDIALRHAPRVVLVKPGSQPERRLAQNPAFQELGHDSGAVLYIRRGIRTPPYW